MTRNPSRVRPAFFLPLVSVFASAALFAQGGGAAAGVEPAPKAPALFDDLGKHHRAISSKSERARRYFDQGLRLVYAFNHDEAKLAFEEAARADPACAICFWGVGLTLGPNINLPAIAERAAAADEAVRAAVALAPKASPVERALIAALRKRYSSPPASDAGAQKRLDTAYADAMRGVARRFPRDLDVQALFAESLMDLRPWDHWTLDGQPQPGTLEIVRTLERVLAKDPGHPGANHYYIHAVEASKTPGRAAASAKRLEAMMPGAGHVVHMPSHIYIRTGRYEEASAANRRAIAADTAYAAKGRPSPIYGMYVAHNHQFLWATAMLQGRAAESLEAARGCVAAAPVEMLRAMPGFDILLTYPGSTLARFGRWDEALREPAPPEDFPFATAMWHYVRGVARTGKGDAEGARSELRELDRIAQGIPADAMESLNSAHDLLAIASKVLGGRIAAAAGDRGGAAKILAEAVAAEDRLHYAEPPDWYYPVRQTLGAVLLADGRAKDAERVYREDLERNPKNGWSLIGLAEALKAQGVSEGEAAARRDFAAAWERADAPLTASDF
ncbi:MAG: hypothetical protein ABI592_04185 [Acidobacteriota bacterium]